ncbi:fibronectin type 3 domain-containing protein [Paenibacillus sp. V4I3]|uniref:OmpL47-type beta-barrel domain-containing protein n=1 Tax=Paenibacillus sp. V4I3 TaxID=3042305 RepID=UPI002782A5D1|nr:putative Ig domain-containing protein [Paenibacillus sp. V4I3]MDQ0877536.1 fibronectin type 3 domain-containing protein [Paenibacillus sp. V4I3]
MRLKWKNSLAFVLTFILSFSNMTAVSFADSGGTAQTGSSPIVDTIAFGDGTSEQAHGFTGTYTSEITGAKGESARVALASLDNPYLGGDLTFNMKVDPDMQNYFTLKTWGSDLGYGVTMLYVNGERLAIQHEGDWQPLYKTMNSPAFGLHPIIPDRFSYSTINLPLELTKEKTELTLTIRTTAEFYTYGMGSFNSFYNQTFAGKKSKAFYAGYTTVTSSLPDSMLEKGTLDTASIAPRAGSDLDSRSSEAVAFANNFIASSQSFVNGYLNDNTKFFSNVSGNDLQTMQIRTFSNYLKDEYRAYSSYGFTPQTSNEVRDKMLDRIRLGIDQYVTYYLNDPASIRKPHQAEWGGFFKYGGEALWTVYNLFLSEDTTGGQGLFGPAYLANDVTGYVPKYRLTDADRANGMTSSFQKWLQGNTEVDWTTVKISNVNAGGTAKNGAFTFTNADPVFFTAQFAQTGVNSDLNVLTHTKKSTRFVGWQELFFMNLSYARTHSSLGNYLTNQNGFQKYGMFKSNLGLISLGSKVAENYNSSLRFLYEGAGITPWLGHDIVDGLVETSNNNSGPDLVVNNLAAFNDATQYDSNRNYIGRKAMQWGDRYLNITEAGLSREPQYAAHYGEHTDLVQEEWRETYDDKLLKKALEISSARANMRYQGLDDNKNRAMRVEGVIESRGPDYPGGLAYQSVLDEEKQLIYVGFERYMNAHADRYAGSEWSKYKQYATNAVGYAQQMFLDHFFLNDPSASSTNVRDQSLLLDYLYASDPANWKGVLLPMSNAEWLLPGERGDGKQQGTYSQDYINSIQQHGFVDVENGLVAARDGNNVMFVSFTRRSNPGLNGLARMHVVTPDNDIMLSLAPNVQYAPSGYWNTKPDWAQFDIAYDDSTPPIDGARLAVAGAIEPIPQQAFEKDLKYNINPDRTGSGYSAFAQFYSVQYGSYMIALNHTADKFGDAKVYDVILPSSYMSGTVYDVISRQSLPVKPGNKVAVGPGTAVVLRLNSQVVNDVPDSSRFVTATAANGKAALSWLHAAGTTGHYDVLRSDDSGATYATIAEVNKNTNHYLDTAVENGKTYYYKVRGVSSSGIAGYDSVYTKVQVASGAINGTWSAANMDGVDTGIGVSAGADGSITMTGDGTNKTINMVDQIAYDKKDSSKSVLEALPDYALAYRTNFVQGSNGVTGDFAFSAKVSSNNALGNTGIIVKEASNGGLVTDSRGLIFTVDHDGNYYITFRQYPNVIPIYDFLADGYNVYDSYMPPTIRGAASTKSADGSYYLKVERHGQYIYPSISADGSTWEKLKTAWVPTADSLYVGVASAKAAQFSDIQLTAAGALVGPGKVYPTYTAANGTVNLSWLFPRGAVNFNVYRTFDEAASKTDPDVNPGADSKWGLVGQHITGNKYSDSGLSTGKTIYYKVVAFDSNGVNGEYSDPVKVSGGVGVPPADTSGAIPIATPWKEAGWNEFQYGATTVNGNKVTLSSLGNGILIGPTDEYNKYHFTYQEIDPKMNYTFIAKVPTSIYNSSLKVGSRIGLMLRNTLDNYSKYAINAISSGDTWIQSGLNKSDTGLSFDLSTTAKIAAGDVWLKIVLNGGNYSAYYSLAPAGTYELLGVAKVQETAYPMNWTQIGSTKALDLTYKDASGATQTRNKIYAGLVLGNRTVYNSINYLYTSPIFAVPDIAISPRNGGTPTTLTGKTDLTVSVGDTVRFHVSATDAFGGSNIQAIGAQLPAGAAFDAATGNIVFTPTADNIGNNSLVFTTKDATSMNSFTGSLGINVKVYNDATNVPILEPIGNKSVVGGNALSFGLRANLENVASISAEAASNGTSNISYSIDSVVKDGTAWSAAALGMSLANGVFNWTPSADSGGSYTVTFKAQTNNAADTQSIIISVLGKPMITVPDQPITFTTNDRATYRFNVVDPAGLNLLYSIGNLPDGASFDASSGTLTWTPAKSQMSRTPNDTYRIDLTSSNGLFAVTKSLYIYVAYQNKSPFFLPIVDFKQIQYTVSASSASGTIASQGNLDNATGTITLNMDLSGASLVHEQHPFFYYVPLYDGGEMISRILSADNARYAGVAVTEDVYDDAPRFLMTGLTTDAANADWGTYKVAVPFRSVKGAGSSKGIFDGSGDAAYFKGKTTPYWARIVRTGDQIKGYVQNADGSWGNGKGDATPLRTISFNGVPNDSAVYAGVAMMGLKVSGVSPVKNNWSAQFDNFSLPNYPLPVTEGAPVSFPVKTVDLDKDPVAVTISNTTLPAGARYELKDGKFTWSNPRAGTYQVTFAASDSEAEAKPMTIVFKVKASSEVNKSELENVITAAKAVTNEDGSYTASSFTALQQAIDKAQAALGTITSYAVLDAEVTALQQAIDALELNVTPPVTVADLQGQSVNDGWFTAAPTLTLTAKGSGSNVVKQVEYSLDGGNNWIVYKGPVELVQEGNYQLLYRSSDLKGNVEVAKPLEVKFDKTAPTITVSGLVYGTFSDTGDVTPIVTLSDDLSGVDSSKTTVTLDTNGVQQGITIPLYTLPLGSHTLIVTSSDLAGNVGSQIVSFQTTTSVDFLKGLVARFTNTHWIDNAGIGNSLQSKLDANNLVAFVNEVKAQSGKHISAEAVKYLLRDAQYLLSIQ